MKCQKNLSLKELENGFHLADSLTGIGNFRPKCKGSFGSFKVVKSLIKKR